MTFAQLRPALLAGLLAGIIFLLVAISGLGFFFMFLPTLPLMYQGMSRGHIHALIGGMVASVMLLVAGPMTSFIFLTSTAIPCWILCRQSLWWTQTPLGPAWYPIGRTMITLTLYGCAAFSLLAMYFALQDLSLAKILGDEIRGTFTDLEDQYGQAIALFVSQWLFLILSITIWLWGLALYAHGWLAHRMLEHKKLNVRPHFNVTLFHMPGWMLYLLAVAALASIAGSENFRFLGNMSLVALMLPYFFYGLAWIHLYSNRWANRRFFLFLMYFTVFVQFWPAMMVSLFGLFMHIKRLSGTTSWSKS